MRNNNHAYSILTIFLLLHGSHAVDSPQIQLNTGSSTNNNNNQVASSVFTSQQQQQQQQQQQKTTNNSNNDLNNLIVSQLVIPQQQAPQASSKLIDLAGANSFTVQTAPPPFENDDPVIYLDYSSFSEQILHKRTANFVYFNANFSNCRNCDKFFAIWKELAVDLRWWRQVIKLFAINCSEEDNIEVCRKAGVSQFPQLKYYWIMSNSLDQDGQRLRILGKSVHAMRHLITDRVLESYVEHNKFLANRNQVQRSGSIGTSLVQPPAGLVTALSSSPTSIINNPILSMIQPMISQLSNVGGVGAAGSSLSSLLSALGSGKGAGLASLSGLMGNLGGLQGISQLLGTFGPSRRQMNVQPMPSNWPELEAIEVQDAEQLLNMLPLNEARNAGALLIMETQEFLYSGLEVMLDLSPYSNHTYIGRVRDERSQLSKNLTKRDDILAPTLIYISATREPRLIMAAPKYSNDEDLRKAFVRAFEKRQIKYPVKRVWPAPSRQLVRVADTQEDEELLSRLHQVHMADLMNALRASLMEQVFRHPELSDDQYNALVKYVYTLINYFPFSNNNDEGLLKFLRRLHTWLQNQVSPMDVSEYKKQFHDVDEVLAKRDWYACKPLSSSKSVPSRSRRPSLLFENPAQLGKVVSNLTRLFRNTQQQGGKLVGLFNALTSNNAAQQQQQGNKSSSNSSSRVLTSSSTSKPSSSSSEQGKREDSPIERIIKSLTSGSLGSDSSILRLISSALTGSSSGAEQQQGSAKFAREYPCGVWKLAHVLVSNEYIKDSPRKDVRHLAIQSLYQYMVNFYACATCGNRVSDVSNEFRIHLDEHLHDQGDSVLLLWKVHNRISKRLESELRPGSPTKFQFPNEQLCPKCRAPRSQNDLASSTPNWHEKQVLLFLVHHYRPQSILSDGSNGTSTSGSSPAPLSFLLLLPLSLCLSLYLQRKSY